MWRVPIWFQQCCCRQLHLHRCVRRMSPPAAAGCGIPWRRTFGYWQRADLRSRAVTVVILCMPPLQCARLATACRTVLARRALQGSTLLVATTRCAQPARLGRPALAARQHALVSSYQSGGGTVRCMAASGIARWYSCEFAPRRCPHMHSCCTTADCSAGYGLVNEVCTICAAGSYSLGWESASNGRVTCSACPAGSTNAVAGSASCHGERSHCVCDCD